VFSDTSVTDNATVPRFFYLKIMKQKIKPSTATKIKSMYQSGIVELSYEEAEKIGLNVGDHISIEPNLLLERQMYFKAYTIKLLDAKKDFEGRWLDQYVDF
jgi:hypothetical protein